MPAPVTGILSYATRGVASSSPWFCILCQCLPLVWLRNSFGSFTASFPILLLAFSCNLQFSSWVLYRWQHPWLLRDQHHFPLKRDHSSAYFQCTLLTCISGGHWHSPCCCILFAKFSKEEILLLLHILTHQGYKLKSNNCSNNKSNKI